jgi:HAD superfamily hydrolase (TIGR01509 family)
MQGSAGHSPWRWNPRRRLVMTSSHERKGLCLDLDGTLAHSLPALYQVYARFVGEYKLTPSVEEFQSLNGPPLSEVVRILRQTHRIFDPEDELIARYQEYVDAAYDIVPAMEGAHMLLQACRNAGWRVAIVTSNNRARAERWLSATGLSALVSLIIAGEDVRVGKPSSEPYELAMAASGCMRSNLAAIEDSISGAASARAADLLTFGFDPEGAVSAWPRGTIPIRSLPEAGLRLGIL